MGNTKAEDLPKGNQVALTVLRQAAGLPLAQRPGQFFVLGRVLPRSLRSLRPCRLFRQGLAASNSHFGETLFKPWESRYCNAI